MFLLSEILDLPVHALVVHVAVIMVPIAAAALIATGWRKDWRRHYSLPIALFATVGAAASIVAAQSGAWLETAVRKNATAQGIHARFGEHPEQGDSAEFFAIFLAVTALAFWALDRWHDRLKLPSWVPMAGYVVALFPALLATVTMVIAGHSGAKLVWKDLGSFAPVT